LKLTFFYHSLLSDWNYVDAHFLRGVARELLARGHKVEIYEPSGGWSLRNLLANQGADAIADFRRAYPQLHSRFYTRDSLDLERALRNTDAIVVHEWNEPELIARIGAFAESSGRIALFHDTRHRSVTQLEEMPRLDLRGYAGVLAFGEALADRYRCSGSAKQAWVWHEAADTRVFYPRARPLKPSRPHADLVWIGDWGDDERAQELEEFLLDPLAALGLKAVVHGTRFPPEARTQLGHIDGRYAGWIASYDVPQAYAAAACTVHIPRQARAESHSGIPTIRVFEALACGIPLVSAPWDDSERLFRPGTDYLVARNGGEMRTHLRSILHEPALAASLREHGLETIRTRHTCAHRVDELLGILGCVATAK
jgi:spore maturation protein CgeB